MRERWSSGSCVTHSLTTTRAPSLDSQENPSQVDREHGSPFHDLSISFSRFLSDSSSFNRFATSAVSKSSRKKSPIASEEKLNTGTKFGRKQQQVTSVRRKKSNLLYARNSDSWFNRPKKPSALLATKIIKKTRTGERIRLRRQTRLPWVRPLDGGGGK